MGRVYIGAIYVSSYIGGMFVSSYIGGINVCPIYIATSPYIQLPYEDTNILYMCPHIYVSSYIGGMFVEV